MKKWKTIQVVLLIISVIAMLYGCQARNSNSGLPPRKVVEKEDADRTSKAKNKRLVVWQAQDMAQNYAERFKQQNQGWEAEVDEINEEMICELALTALASGNAPDLFVLKVSQLGNFRMLDVFEDLLPHPYNAARYKPSIYGYQWERGLSLDRKHLLALPHFSVPMVTYYRQDIFKELGLPSEPEELGDYMEKPENYINLLTKLKEHGRWGVSWAHQISELAGSGMGYFDSAMNFTRNNRSYASILQCAKDIRQNGLESNINYWTEWDRKEVRNGNVVMLMIASWGTGLLEEWAPDTYGKWRVTRLPLGIRGYWDEASLSITKDSPHKEAAWEYLKLVCEDSWGRLSADGEYQSGFLGGQRENAVYDKIASGMPVPFPTSLDGDAEKLWNSEIDRYLESDDSAEDTLIRIEQQVHEVFGRERAIVKNYLGQGSVK